MPENTLADHVEKVQFLDVNKDVVGGLRRSASGNVITVGVGAAHPIVVFFKTIYKDGTETTVHK